MYALNIDDAVLNMTVKIPDAIDVLIPSAEMLKKYGIMAKKYFDRVYAFRGQNELLIEVRDRLHPSV